MEAVLLQAAAAGRQQAGLGSRPQRSGRERSSREETQSDKEEGRRGKTNGR